MIANETKIKVTNRDNGTVGYMIPDLNNRPRDFRPNETKEITFEELRALLSLPGGSYLLHNCFTLDNAEAVQELLGEVEPEYFYTEEKVKDLLVNGSIEELEDCLNFAPDGVIEIIKKHAVDIELNDVRKRDLICEKTELNVNKAIELNKMTKLALEAEGVEEKEPKVRKASKPTIETTTRKAAPPKYNVINK